MEPVAIGVRAHDSNPGLVTVSSGLVNRYFRDTRLMGAAAQVITLLSGLQVVRLEPLMTAAGEIGIDDSLLERTISELQEMDQLRVVEERDGNHRVEPRLDDFQEMYERIGDRWTQRNPTPLEEAAIEILDRLSVMPHYEDDLREKYDLESEEFHVIRDVLESASVIGVYQSPVNGRTVLHSPIYWEDNPEKFFAVQELHGCDDVVAAMSEVRQYQGFPEDRVTDEVLRAVVETGVLPTVTVTSSAGPKRFLFTPQQGRKRVERVILTKAFALLSCLRYGQHHARITRLRWSATSLLRHLRDAKRIGPHSEALAQYSPLVELLMGSIEEGPAGRYTFNLEDTPQNIAALNLAIELSQIGEPVLRTQEADAAATKLLLPPGSFHDTGRTRIEVRRGVRKTQDSARRVAAIISGVSSDIV